jgi:hypothetical protein
MKGSKLTDVIRRLASLAIDAPKKLGPKTMNEQWTKKSLIVPLMEALGWDDPFEVLPEDSPENVEDSIDYLLKPNRPGASSLCLEAKPLLSDPPQTCDHGQIKKGLEQTKARGSDYFIWTNGRTWQVFALALPNAEIYEVDIGETRDDENKIQKASHRLKLLSRETVVNNPQTIVDQITIEWKETALPKALLKLTGEPSEEFIKLMRKALPQELDFSNEEIVQFVRGCRWNETGTPPGKEKGKRFIPCKEEWEKLVTSREPRYERARETLLSGLRRNLGEYLVGDNYEPWRKTVTFTLLKLKKRGSDTKGVTGPAVELYRKYGFMEIVDPHVREDEITYKRVDEAMEYLARILQSG